MENGKTESIIPLHFARKSTTRSADANYSSWNKVRFIFSLKKKKKHHLVYNGSDVYNGRGHACMEAGGLGNL